MKKDEIILAAEECRAVLEEMMGADEEVLRGGGKVVLGEVVRDLLVQCQLAEAQLAEAVAATRSGSEQGSFILRSLPLEAGADTRLADQALVLGNQLSAILDRAKELYDPAPVESISDSPSTPAAPVDSSPLSSTDELAEEQEIITLDATSSEELASEPPSISSSIPPSLDIPTEIDLDNSALSPRCQSRINPVH